MSRTRTIDNLINKCPCLDCEDRKSDCHKGCKPYKEWEREHERFKQQKRVIDGADYFQKWRGQDHKHKFPDK